MAIIETTVSPGSEAFEANRSGMLALLERVRGYERRSIATSEKSRERFEKRGQLLPRERLSLLLDPGTSFLEIGSLAGLGLDNEDLEKSVPGGGVIGGIGWVSGVRVMINASDSGIEAGALQPMGIPKQLRLQELALENKLPYVQLVESAGANLMTYKVEEFITGGNLFRNIARISAAGLPVVTVTHGSSTAGGAYQTGLSDYIVMVRGRSRAFLAGPPLLKAATGEVATEEELGGALMHTSISGLGDYLAEDDRDAIRIAREILANIDWNRDAAAAPARAFKPPRYDAESLLGIMPMDHKRPVDMKQVIAHIADDSEFLEFGENYGGATVVGHIKIEGMPVGVVTNNGPIDPAGATKATHFIQACCQSKTPLLYLNNTTGFMVGKDYEEAGIIKHGSKMIQAVTNATVPQITLYCGASFGAGNYGMCGRGFHPRFCFSWPNAKTAVMGGEQAAKTMVIVTEAAMKRKGEVDQAKLDAMEKRIVEHFDSQMSVFTTSARLLDDGVIDPRDTREVLAKVLSICRDAEAREPQKMQFSVARP
ncbi:carboxyl transferase domain-containing protein [Variovorax sp. RTB1]|uniref:acyl-CoA carboxylase subunit beta n=1 Tax=Variovorax sp. RTB1 TaxID=3048631 RepID=UPI002B23A94F|nr:carboxyl transferase domain-containing protein [Variovorax sp. RTB1]MEB0112829.1 carboxyl transferase domain-containing protein [Variovorax sp. RTB1]